MQGIRDKNGRFIKNHPSLIGKWNKDRFEKMKPYLFKKDNKIRNSGRTRFKKGQALQKGKYKLSTILNLWFPFEFFKRSYPSRRKILIEKFCLKCNKKFYTKRANQKYCNNPCRYKFEKGHPQPKEWIDKQRIQISGDRCWLWKGGVSKEPYGLEFNKLLKEQIRKRDNFRCQECFRHQDELRDKKNRKYKLLIHHIDFNKKNNSPNNMISLCRDCHLQTNYNREEWTEYFQNKVIKIE